MLSFLVLTIQTGIMRVGGFEVGIKTFFNYGRRH